MDDIRTKIKIKKSHRLRGWKAVARCKRGKVGTGYGRSKLEALKNLLEGLDRDAVLAMSASAAARSEYSREREATP